MIVTLDNDVDLGATQEFLNIDIRKRTIPFTIRQIANFYAAHEEVEIQINKALFPQFSSYKVNPAQLAKNANVSAFVHAHATTKGQFVVILFTNKDKPMSFWQQCLDYCQLQGTYEFELDEVPSTYRHTPSLLKWRLKQATGKNIRVIKTPKRFKLVVPRVQL